MVVRVISMLLLAGLLWTPQIASAQEEDTLQNVQEQLEEAQRQLQGQMERLREWTEDALGNREENVESLGRHFEEHFSRVGEQMRESLGALGRRFTPPETLDTPLELTFSFDPESEPVSMLCATSHFQLDTERARHVSDGAHEERMLHVRGEVEEFPDSGTFLIRYEGSFAVRTSREASGEEGGEERSVEESVCDFEGSAVFELGERKVLIDNGGRKLALSVNGG